MTDNVMLIQGPNLVALGHREPEFYGRTTAAELDAMVLAEAPAHNLSVDIHYLSREGDAMALLDHAEQSGAVGLIMNPAGFLYAGERLRERVALLPMPYVEVHITNIENRGKRSVLAPVADGMIAGFGVGSYMLALSAMRAMLDRRNGSAV